MSRNRHSRYEKLSWNKSQLLESNTYIKSYVEALNKAMPAEDRQTLFMISKMFTDGAANVGSNKFNLARHHYERGMQYVDKEPEDKEVLKRFLTNIYDRSKSLYHYKVGERDDAIKMIHNTLENNRFLEGHGFEFLLFDRISQYHNLARVYFAMNKVDEAFKILSDAIAFLMSGKAHQLTDLNDNHIREYNDNTAQMRFSLICLLLFETTNHLLNEKDEQTFAADSELFFGPILKARPQFFINSADEIPLRNWINVIDKFFNSSRWWFRRAAKKFLKKEPKFYSGKPHLLINKVLERA